MSGPAGGEHSGVHYEHRDASAGAILKFLIGLAVVLAFSALAVLALFHAFAREESRHDPPSPPLAPLAGRLPPEPRLQENPMKDLEQVRAQEEHDLTHYGWVDKKAGVVRIPVEEAMRIAGERGLPSAWPSPPPTPSPAASPALSPGSRP